MLVPRLRFKEFNKQWNKYKLEELVIFLDGQRKPIKDADRNKFRGVYPYYGASGIIDYVKDYIFDKDTILLGEDGANILTRSTRLAFIASGKYWVNNHAHVLEPKNTNIYFLCELLESLNYEQYNTGTAQPKLNQEVCKNIELTVPDIVEQSKIGNFLSLLNKKIELQKQKIEALKIYKKGLMNLLLNNSSNTYVVCLKNICTIRKGQQLNKENMSLSGNYYVLNGGSELSGYTNDFNVQENTISISEGGNSCGFVNFNFEKFWAGGHCYILDNISQDINIYYLYHLLKYNQEKIMNLRVGSGLPNIQKKSLENFELFIDDPKTQHYIYKILNSLDCKIDLEINKFESLNLLKKSLLQQMFI